jgi:SAM-dependent methyltransferase
VTPDERWLAAVWPFVRASLPTTPASVVEIGCGPLGGFVPMLGQAGYQATGVDPQAPPGPSYRQVEFERYDLPGRVDAVVACTSLHHVADLGRAARRRACQDADGTQRALGGGYARPGRRGALGPAWSCCATARRARS